MVKVRVPGFTNLYRTRHGLYDKARDIWAPRAPVGWNVRGALYLPTGEKEALLGHNLISDAGDLHYAQRMASEAVTNAFGIHELATAVPATHLKADDRSDFTMQSGSQKAFSSGYPKRNDTDTDNTGKGTDIVTYKVEYTAADGNWTTSLLGGIITNSTPGASEPILTGYTFGSGITKTSSQALTIWINHSPTGV